jgi:uncharacterized membrane protein YdbT with pleckstrin-like domain
MKPASKKAIETLINIERLKYTSTTEPTLQWLLRVTKLQMNTATDRAMYHQVRLVHEALRREIERRSQLDKQWDLDREAVATQRDDLGSQL